MKYRHPDSFEFALYAIAKAIGWPRVAEIASRTDRTVRDWSDPDSPRTPPIATAAALDRAWSHAGRVGAPLADALSRQVTAVPIVVEFDRVHFGEMTVACAREVDEGKQALLEILVDGPSPDACRRATIEISEGIAIFHAMLPLVTYPIACPP